MKKEPGKLTWVGKIPDDDPIYRTGPVVMHLPGPKVSSVPTEATRTMRVAGLDWSAQKENRAKVVLSVENQIPRVTEVEPNVDDSRACEICTDASLDLVAVDAPFGWPQSFVDFVHGWSALAPSAEPVPERRHFQFRLTELIVQQELKKKPLSVSSNLLALTALSWARFVHNENLFPRIDVGTGPETPAKPAIIEVYPAPTLNAFTGPDRPAFETLLEMFRFQCRTHAGSHLNSAEQGSHVRDACIAALTGLIYLGGVPRWTVRRPSNETELTAAKREGWIFFPVRS